jgi:predicted NACHT family NTPase
LDERDSITRESIRNKLAEDRPVSEPLDEHVLHRITRKEVLLQNEAKTEKITDIIKRCQWIVFLGDPGSGKSTLMRFLAQYHADHLLNPETSKQGTHRIPVAVRLSSFAEKCAANESLSLLDYIYATKKLMAKVLERC